MRAVITDLDRTLLRTDKSVSEYTRSVLNRCRRKGLPVMAADDTAESNDADGVARWIEKHLL